MKFVSDFITLDKSEILDDAKQRCLGGWRYVQILAVNCDGSVDLVYSYMLDGRLENVVVHDVTRQDEIKSISEVYFEAFVCENEIHDLFGVSFDGIAIDFLGNFYKVANEYPMTIISPEQLAAREKARKIAEAKAAKEAKKNSESSSNDGASEDSSKKKGKTLEEEEAELEERLKNMPPEKAEKVRAAFILKKQKASENARSEGEE